MSQEETDAFTAKMEAAFRDVDAMTQFVLRAHLMLEERLNNILRSCLYNPDIFDKMKLTFATKMLFAQAFAVSQNGSGMWELIAAINTLRNSIAHSLDDAHRQQRFQRLREIYLRELEKPELRQEDENEVDHLLFLKAYALCEGYVRGVEQDAQMAGRFIRSTVGAMRKEWYEPQAEGS